MKNILVVFFIFFLLVANVYGGEVELTTYYPAPDGEYKTMSTTENTSLATTSGNVNVGSTSNNTNLTIYNTLSLAPVTGTQTGGVDGSLRYRSDIQQFVYKKGSTWQTLAGAGGIKVAMGVLNGNAVIPIPAGYTASQCSWIISQRRDPTVNDKDVFETQWVVDGNRRVKVYERVGGVSDWADYSSSATCNYLIICGAN